MILTPFLRKKSVLEKQNIGNLKPETLHFPNVKIDEKGLDNLILMHKQKCERDKRDKHKHLTLDEAKLQCNKKSSCKGFTFNSYR